VVAHRRPGPTLACVDGLLRQSESRLQVIVIFNDASAEVVQLIEQRASDPRLCLVTCSAATASEARNEAVAVATAPILYFLDDDVEVPPDGVASVLDAFERHPIASIIGGPNLTPPDDPDFAQMSGDLLASTWGTGVARSRYGQRGARRARERDLILCNLAIKKPVFEAGLRFPFFFGGEENVLMGYADQRGYVLWYCPEIWVYHRRRRNLRDFAAQVFRYGRGRALALRAAPRTFHPAYLVPVAFLAYLCVLPILAAISLWTAVPLAVYAVGTLGSSLKIALKRRRPGWLFPLPFLFLVTHCVYALGVIDGFLRPPRRSRARVVGSTMASRA
jgi:succinoglycan biosynthesis protein ExoA